MAQTAVVVGTATTVWSAVTLAAGTESDHYYLNPQSKAGPAPAFMNIAISFSAVPTAIQIDLDWSQGGVIWKRVKSFTDVGGGKLTVPFEQGFYRLICIATTGPFTTTATFTPYEGLANVSIGLLTAQAAEGAVTGALMEYGSSSAPIIKDTTNTVFMSGYFKHGATSGDVKGLSISLEVTGLLHTFETAIYGYLYANCATGNVRNPVAVQGDLTFANTTWVQGLGYGVGTYITFPAKSCQTGTFSGMNIEFSIPSGWSGHLNNVKHSMLRFAIGGTGVAAFEDSGHLFELAGFTEGTGNIFSAGADVAAAATLRIKVGGTNYYILLGAGEST